MIANPLARPVSRLQRALRAAPLLLGACIPWVHDDRPWLVNSTAEMLEVDSTHADGHTLKIMLYPGTRVPLGAAEEPVLEIAVRRPRVPVVLVPQSEIKSCLEDRARRCQGWLIGSEGVEPIEKPHAKSPVAPAVSPQTGADAQGSADPRRPLPSEPMQGG
jgi:hypothetical protein